MTYWHLTVFWFIKAWHQSHSRNSRIGAWRTWTWVCVWHHLYIHKTDTKLLENLLKFEKSEIVLHKVAKNIPTRDCRRENLFSRLTAKKNFSSVAYLFTNKWLHSTGGHNLLIVGQKHMQRCPYIHEMKERLLGSQRTNTLAMESFDRERDNLLENASRPGSNQVGTVATVVKVRVSSFDTPKKIQVIQTF